MTKLPTQSNLEEALAFQMRATGLPTPARQFRFAPPRRWRADLAFPAYRLLLECDGATWVAGRHTRGAGHAADAEKANAAQLLGFIILRFTREHIESGYALATIEQALALRKRQAVA